MTIPIFIRLARANTLDVRPARVRAGRPRHRRPQPAHRAPRGAAERRHAADGVLARRRGGRHRRRGLAELPRPERAADARRRGATSSPPAARTSQEAPHIVLFPVARDVHHGAGVQPRRRPPPRGARGARRRRCERRRRGTERTSRCSWSTTSRTYFTSSRGLVRAVDGVSFTLGAAAARSASSASPAPARRCCPARSWACCRGKNTETPTGRVLFDGRDLRKAPKRAAAARSGASDVGVVFQDPMTSLNPVMKIGEQITESLRHHLGRRARATPASAAVELLALGRHHRARAPPRASTRTSSPAGCASGSRSPWRSSCGPELLIADEPTTALDVTVQAPDPRPAAGAAARAARWR